MPNFSGKTKLIQTVLVFLPSFYFSLKFSGNNLSGFYLIFLTFDSLLFVKGVKTIEVSG